ncbi:MAG: tetratricopeptide repeat protein [Candidatus Methanoperedens sp.]
MNNTDIFNLILSGITISGGVLLIFIFIFNRSNKKRLFLLKGEESTNLGKFEEAINFYNEALKITLKDS